MSGRKCLRRMLLPLIKKYWVLMLAMILVSSLGIALLVGLRGGYRSTAASLTEYVENYRYADAVLTVTHADGGDAEKLASIDGVSEVNTRVVVDGQMSTGTGKSIAVRIFSFDPGDFQRFFVWEKRIRGGQINLLVEKRLAGWNGLQTRDTVRLLINGRSLEANVGRIVSSPECLAMQRNEFDWGQKGDFGFVFVDASEISSLPGLADLPRQYLLRFAEGADGEHILEEARELLEPSGLVSSFLYDESPVHSAIERNLDPMHTVSVLLPVFFFLCTLLVEFLLLSQMISLSRREIGILRALGFGRGEIQSLFHALALLETIPATALGIGIGQFLMKLESGKMIDYFSLPESRCALSARDCLTAFLLSMLVGQLATLLSGQSLLQVTPQEAMSREITASTRSPRLVRALLRRVPPRAKYGLLSGFRGKRRFAVSTVCAAAACMMLFASFAFKNAKDQVIVNYFDRSIRYDSASSFTVLPDDKTVKRFSETSGVEDYGLLRYFVGTVSFDGKTEEVLVNGVDPETDLLYVYDAQGQRLAIPERGIVLEEYAAQALGASVGDTVCLGEDCFLEVTAISRQNVSRTQYISLTAAEELSVPQSYVLLERGGEKEELLKRCAKCDGYSYTKFVSTQREGCEEMFVPYDTGVSIVIAFAMLLGFAVIFNTTQTGLFEQRRELSVLRALGFQVSDISAVWLSQSLVTLLAACAVGLPCGAALAKYLLAEMSSSWQGYYLYNTPWQYVLTVALCAAYVLLSHAAAMRSVRRWNLPENTGDRE